MKRHQGKIKNKKYEIRNTKVNLQRFTFSFLIPYSLFLIPYLFETYL